ncbi:MAG: rod shape-determining protein [Candidatus Magasanikbacteria bacterium]
MLFTKYLGIDLGTDTTRIYLKDNGIVVNEPSIVAVNDRTDRVVAVGQKAKEMLSRTPTHVTALRPVDNGVIADFDMAKEMVQRFLNSNSLPWSWFTEIVGTIPTNLTEVERKSVMDLLEEVGASDVYLLEEPLAAAFSGHLEVDNPTAYLMVDIGSGTTDMAIISMNGIVISERLKIAGRHFDRKIIQGVEKEFNLDIGEPTAEKIKLGTGTVVSDGESSEVTIRGRDIKTGLPKEMNISGSQVKEWLSPPVKKITESLKDLIEETPPELVGDVYKNGIYIAGGGSLLRGIDRVISEEVGVETNIINEPQTCVARGSGIVVEDLQNYEHLLNNFAPSPLNK